MRISKPLVAAASCLGLVAASLLQSPTPLRASGAVFFPKQVCKSDGVVGCPDIANCPVPGNSTYYCQRDEGPDSKSCQGVAAQQCWGNQNFSCGLEQWCGSNLSTGNYWFTNPDGSGYWTANVCSQKANRCNLIP